jgi:hypothetical protein
MQLNIRVKRLVPFEQPSEVFHSCHIVVLFLAAMTLSDKCQLH